MTTEFPNDGKKERSIGVGSKKGILRSPALEDSTVSTCAPRSNSQLLQDGAT
jgi:hypothetical protein